MRQFLINWLVVLLVWLGSGIGISPAASAAVIDPELESAVLQIIQQHPDVILNSLVEYQQFQSTTPQPINLPINQIQNWIGTSPVQGNLATATVVLVEFSDFECPYCAAASPQIRSFLNQNPDIAFVYKHLPLKELHPQAIAAAKAAWAAGEQGKFWEYHDALFAQSNLDERAYLQSARQIGLNLRQFEDDRQSDRATQALQYDAVQAQEFNISATPTFLFVTHQSSYLIKGFDIKQFQILTLSPTSSYPL